MGNHSLCSYWVWRVQKCSWFEILVDLGDAESLGGPCGGQIVPECAEGEWDPRSPFHLARTGPHVLFERATVMDATSSTGGRA